MNKHCQTGALSFAKRLAVIFIKIELWLVIIPSTTLGALLGLVLLCNLESLRFLGDAVLGGIATFAIMCLCLLGTIYFMPIIVVTSESGFRGLAPFPSSIGGWINTVLIYTLASLCITLIVALFKENPKAKKAY